MTYGFLGSQEDFWRFSAFIVILFILFVLAKECVQDCTEYNYKKITEESGSDADDESDNEDNSKDNKEDNSKDNKEDNSKDNKEDNSKDNKEDNEDNESDGDDESNHSKLNELQNSILNPKEYGKLLDNFDKLKVLLWENPSFSSLTPQFDDFDVKVYRSVTHTQNTKQSYITLEIEDSKSNKFSISFNITNNDLPKTVPRFIIVKDEIPYKECSAYIDVMIAYFNDVVELRNNKYDIVISANSNIVTI